MSGEKVTTARPRPTPVLFAPSARIAVLPARPPLMLTLKPGAGMSCAQLGVFGPGHAADVADGQHQVEHAAIVERQIPDLALGDRLPRRAGFGVDQRCFRDDVDYGFDRAGFKRDIDRSRDGRVNLDAIDHGLLEARRLHRDAIDYRFKRRRCVCALLRSRQLLRSVRSDIGDGDLSAGNDCAGLIEDRAADAATIGLSGNGGDEKDGDE